MTRFDSRPIGVFDSGLGGLTVVQEMRRRLPHENLIYVGDTARLPYGTKSPDTIKKYSLQIAFFLIQKRVKALVVACNSVSAVALPQLKHLPLPVVGVIEPGARAAVLKSRHMKIGVIGTRATVQSHAYARAIHELSPRANVVEVACPLFVPFVEEGWTEGPVIEEIAATYLKPLKWRKIDTLVLGCTHYPLLKPMIRSVVGPHIQLIDSAEETAKDVKSVLEKNNALNKAPSQGKISFFVTDHPSSFVIHGRRFFGSTLRDATRLRLENI